MLNNMAKPILKWAGGKTQMLGDLLPKVPKNYGRYIEPFFGGGAMFFALQPENAIIADSNPELINMYRQVATNVDEVITCLKKYENTAELFYSVREQDWNCLPKAEAAARTIFLNRTCFNGLYRVNSKGEFNVPHGRYANPKICDKDNLLAVSKLLQKVEILCGDFEATGKYADANTIFYLDPPYKPISDTSSFTSYATGRFDDAEQIRLRNFCAYITEKQAKFIASNSDPIEQATGLSYFDQLYAQFSIKRVVAPRFINANANNRGLVSEIMISNVVNL